MSRKEDHQRDSEWKILDLSRQQKYYDPLSWKEENAPSILMAPTAGINKSVTYTTPHLHNNLDFDPELFPLGVFEDGSVATVKITGTPNPHALIMGSNTQARSSAVRNVLLHAAAHDRVWDIYGVDTTDTQFTPYRKHFKQLATDSVKAASMLKLVVEEMNQRNEIFEKLESHNIISHNRIHPAQKMKYILVIVEDMQNLVYGADTGIVVDLLGKLARLGRSAGIAVVLSSSQISSNNLRGETRANLGNRILTDGHNTNLTAYTLDSFFPDDPTVTTWARYEHAARDTKHDQFIAFKHPQGEPFPYEPNPLNQYSTTYSDVPEIASDALKPTKRSSGRFKLATILTGLAAVFTGVLLLNRKR